MKALAALASVLLFITSPAAAELRVGAAAERITPPVGTPMAGYYSPRSVEGVDDELFAKALVLERDGVKVAMVVCDLITMPRSVTEKTRELITAATGIPADHIMVSATHTHTGPLVLVGSTRDPQEGEALEKARAYLDDLPRWIVSAVRKANDSLTPARASAAAGMAENLSFNRRYVMKDGRVGWNPGKLNPKIVRPAGPVDPEVPVVYFESADASSKPIATHVSFAMHLDTVGTSRASADFPGALAAALAEAKGPDMLTIFATGACGDINHIDVSHGRKQEGLDEARRIGNALAAEVLRAYERLSPVGDGPLRAKNQIVPLPLAEIDPGEFAKAREVILKPAKSRMSMDRVQAFKVLDVAARKGKPLEVEVQVISLGDEVAWVALPGEIFVELGLEVKKRSPFKHTIIVELANGSIGYIPTKRAFAEGNYEAVSARCAPGSGEMLVEAAVRLLNDLHP